MRDRGGEADRCEHGHAGRRDKGLRENRQLPQSLQAPASPAVGTVRECAGAADGGQAPRVVTHGGIEPFRPPTALGPVLPLEQSPAEAFGRQQPYAVHRDRVPEGREFRDRAERTAGADQTGQGRAAGEGTHGSTVGHTTVTAAPVLVRGRAHGDSRGLEAGARRAVRA